MIVVSVARTWPLVLSGHATAEAATQGAWPLRLAEFEHLDEFADVIAGVFREQVVSVFEIIGWRWETNAERAAALRQGLSRQNPRIVFDIASSQAWAGLIGTANPGRPFTQWPVQYIHTAKLTRPLSA
jgi:hypothetical protein